MLLALFNREEPSFHKLGTTALSQNFAATDEMKTYEKFW